MLGGGALDERELAERLLDGIRLLGLLSGVLCDCPDLIPEELQMACIHILRTIAR